MDEVSVEGLKELAGRLSGDVGPYAGSDGLEVNIHLQADNQRPLFFVVPDDQALGRDQRQGISMHRVLEYLEPFTQNPDSVSQT